MKLEKAHLDKIRDKQSQTVLETARDDTELRVILTLDADSEAAEVQETPSQAPDESREAYRERLISTQTSQRARILGETIKQLSQQSLDVKGKDTKRVTRRIVVDGTAANIMKGLELPGVIDVQVDRPMANPKPDSTPGSHNSLEGENRNETD